MTAAISLVIVISLSFLIVRIGTIALSMTGLSEDIASFQSLSAFSGVGFTTEEAESVLITRARRRVIKMLIRMGSVGVVTAISSLFLSFTNPQEGLPSRLLFIVSSVLILMILSRSQWFQRLITPLIRRFLERTGAVYIHDYTSLLHMREGYSVSEIEVTEDSWLSGGALRELRLRAEGITVLGIIRKSGEYIGVPLPHETFNPGDRLLVYGRTKRLLELSERQKGDQETHESAMREQEEVVAEEHQADQ